MTPTQAAIDFSPLVNIALQAFGVILMALASVAAAYIAQHFKLKNQDQIRTAFLDSADRAVSYATAQAKVAEAAGEFHVSVKDQTIAAASNYLIQQVPGAIKSLGITPDGVEKLVEAKMAQAAGVALPPTLTPAAAVAPAIAPPIAPAATASPGVASAALGKP